MDNKRTVTEICRRDTQLRKTVDQLNILVFGVDHRASDKINTDLAEVYHEALQKVYDYAVASFNETLQQMLLDVPGLIPEDQLKKSIEEHLSQLEIDERIERALERPFEEVLDELLGN